MIDFEPKYYDFPKIETPIITVVANYRPEKNILQIIDVVKSLKEEKAIFKMKWYGHKFFINNKPSEQSNNYLEAKKKIDELNISDYFELNDISENVNTIYQSGDAILLASKFEGFPNVVCEALANGRIILASSVSDLPLLIKTPDNGYIFNTDNSETIKSAIKWLINLSDEEKKNIGYNNVNLATELFDQNKIIQQYINLIKQ